jgi:hypothetical protein
MAEDTHETTPHASPFDAIRQIGEDGNEYLEREGSW